MGLNGALSIAAGSLEVFSAGMQVAGNNVANANTPGYIREQLQVNSTAPTVQGRLTLGTGVTATGIRQQIDKFLERRIHSANSDYSGSQSREAIYKQLEGTLGELGDADLSTAFSNLVGKINDVLNQPESAATRQIAVREGVQFTTAVKDLRRRIDEQRTGVNGRVKDLVNETNRLLDQVQELNAQIVTLEGSGLSQSDAGTLRGQRYAALNRLSEILPISAVERSTGGVDVILGSEQLVVDGTVQHLETIPGIDRNLGIDSARIETTNIAITGTRGELNGTLNGRDTVLGGFIDQLDTLTSNVIFEFNKIHASGQGTHGYDTLTSTAAVNDVNAALDAAGLSFTPEHGGFQIEVINQTTGLAQTRDISINLNGIGTKTTLTDLNTQLGAVGNITASIGVDRRLTITANSGYEIEFQNDTSHVLAALGINTFFTGSTSNDIGVNSQITADSGLFAAADGGGPADGRNAARLAAFLDNPVQALKGVSIGQFYEFLISNVGQSSASESALADGSKGFLDSLMNQRTQSTGVSVDEEVIQMMQYQHAYQVAAKFISTVDQLLTTLMQV